MFSIYTSAFNIIKNKFNYKYHIENFCNFADKVFIAVNKSEDNTLQVLLDLKESFSNLEIISTNINYNDPLLDGKIKNEALKFAESCGDNYLIGVDLDEEIFNQDKIRWKEFADLFLGYYKYDAMLIPSVNLWGDRYSVRWDNKNNKTYKWYCHRKGLTRRPVKQGITSDGFLDISVSDGCEICYEDGTLANSIRIDQVLDNITDCTEYYKKIKEEYIYVLHTGYVDIDNRLIRVNNFWENQWKRCSNQKEVEIIKSKKEFLDFSVLKHNLFN